MRAAAIAVIAAGCTIPGVDLGGKHCPCADGYTCDTPTDTCLPSAGADAPPGTPDSSTVDGSFDAGPVSSCLGSNPGPQVFSDPFLLLQGWTTVGGSWSVTDEEMVQGDGFATLTYGHPNATLDLSDYRVKTKMRMLDGTDGEAMEISFRKQPVGSAQYHCNWEPTDGMFMIQYTDATGTGNPVLALVQIDIATIPLYDPTTPVIMEVEAIGSQLRCCLRGIPGAALAITDTTFATGGPGLKTYAMAAAFDDFAVYSP